MDVVILTIGSEILKGRTVNTNAAYIAGKLYAAGFNVVQERAVADGERLITRALGECFSAADCGIATGGLGIILWGSLGKILLALVLSPLTGFGLGFLLMFSLNRLLARLTYTSHSPANGGEEPKSVVNYGIGVQAVFREGGRRKIGFGSETSDISPDGVRAALEKARRGASDDPEFKSLPRPTGPVRHGNSPGAAALRNDLRANGC